MTMQHMHRDQVIRKSLGFMGSQSIKFQVKLCMLDRIPCLIALLNVMPLRDPKKHQGLLFLGKWNSGPEAWKDSSTTFLALASNFLFLSATFPAFSTAVPAKIKIERGDELAQ